MKLSSSCGAMLALWGWPYGADGALWGRDSDLSGVLQGLVATATVLEVGRGSSAGGGAAKEG